MTRVREHRLRPARAAARGPPVEAGDPRAGRGTARAGAARLAGRPLSRASCPAASASAWRWRARWRSSRACCCSTSRSARSTPRCARNCAAGCARCTTRSTSPRLRHPRPGRGARGGRPGGGDEQGRIEQIGTPGEVYDEPGHRLRPRLPRRIDDAAGRGRRWQDPVRRQVLDLEPANARPGPSKLFVRRHDMHSVQPAAERCKEPSSASAPSGRRHRADILFNAVGQETLIEIDAPRDRVLRPGDIVGLQPRRYRIFAAQD